MRLLIPATVLFIGACASQPAAQSIDYASLDCTSLQAELNIELQLFESLKLRSQTNRQVKPYNDYGRQSTADAFSSGAAIGGAMRISKEIEQSQARVTTIHREQAKKNCL